MEFNHTVFTRHTAHRVVIQGSGLGGPKSHTHRWLGRQGTESGLAHQCPAMKVDKRPLEVRRMSHKIKWSFLGHLTSQGGETAGPAGDCGVRYQLPGLVSQVTVL